MIPTTSAKYSFRLCVLPHIWEEHSIRTKQPVHTSSNLWYGACTGFSGLNQNHYLGSQLTEQSAMVFPSPTSHCLNAVTGQLEDLPAVLEAGCRKTAVRNDLQGNVFCGNDIYACAAHADSRDCSSIIVRAGLIRHTSNSSVLRKKPMRSIRTPARNTAPATK